MRFYLVAMLLLASVVFAKGTQELELEKSIRAELLNVLERTEFGEVISSVAVDLRLKEKPEQKSSDSLTYAPPYFKNETHKAQEIASLRIQVLSATDLDQVAQESILKLIKGSFNGYPLRVSFEKQGPRVKSAKAPQPVDQKASEAMPVGLWVALAGFFVLCGLSLVALLFFIALKRIFRSEKELEDSFEQIQVKDREIEELKRPIEFKPEILLEPRIELKPQIDLKPEIDLKPTIEMKPKVEVQPVLNFTPKIDLKIPKLEIKGLTGSSEEAFEKWQLSQFQLNKNSFMDFLRHKPDLTKRVLRAQNKNNIALFKFLFKHLNRAERNMLKEALGAQTRIFSRASGESSDDQKRFHKVLSSVIDDLCIEESISKELWVDVLGKDGMDKLNSMSQAELFKRVEAFKDPRLVRALAEVLPISRYRGLLERSRLSIYLEDVLAGSMSDQEAAQLMLDFLRSPPPATVSATIQRNRSLFEKRRLEAFYENFDSLSFHEEREQLAQLAEVEPSSREELRKFYWGLKDLETLSKNILWDWFYTLDTHTLTLVFHYTKGAETLLHQSLENFLHHSNRYQNVVEWDKVISACAGPNEHVLYSRGLRQCINHLRQGSLRRGLRRPRKQDSTKSLKKVS